MSGHDIGALKVKRICHECVGEVFLKAEIEREGQWGKCSYCGEAEPSEALEDVADHVNQAFEDHYYRTSDQPDAYQQMLLSDDESNYTWTRDGLEVVEAIGSAGGFPERVAAEIQAILEDKHADMEAAQMGDETPFASDSYYEEKGASDLRWQLEWRSFVQSLKTEARLFNRAAEAHLSAVFDHVDELRGRDGRSVILAAGPDTSIHTIFRARAFQSDQTIEAALGRPDLHLGPPPTELATPGRMNARGISVCYGATTAQVAIAEVRPPVGSQVAVAPFKVIRPLRLLDLAAFNDLHTNGSIFDRKYVSVREREAFLHSLCGRIARPVMPDDEAFEYLPTQAVSDFLATSEEARLDGIVFPSVQRNGAGDNIMLFHKASRVEILEMPKGTDVRASSWTSTEDGPEREYVVIEEIPPVVGEPRVERDATINLFEFDVGASDPPEPERIDVRPVTLRVAADSVEVHIIKSVTFDADDHAVRRHRWTKRSDL